MILTIQKRLWGVIMAINKIILLIPIIIVFQLGCSTPAYFDVPAQRFESPAVSGKTLKGAVGVGLHNPIYVVTVKDTASVPPISSGSEITRDPDAFDIDVIDNIAIDLRVGLGNMIELTSTPGLYGLKFQFLGSSRIEAKSNELLASIIINQMNTGERTSTVSSIVSKVKSTGYGGGLIVGYRDSSEMVYYLHGNHLEFEATTDITNSTVYNYKGKGTQTGAILGIKREPKEGFYVALEIAYTKTAWETLEEKEYGTGGLIFGTSW